MDFHLVQEAVAEGLLNSLVLEQIKNFNIAQKNVTQLNMAVIKNDKSCQ